jgi:hypothetical protein
VSGQYRDVVRPTGHDVIGPGDILAATLSWNRSEPEACLILSEDELTAKQAGQQKTPCECSNRYKTSVHDGFSLLFFS